MSDSKYWEELARINGQHAAELAGLRAENERLTKDLAHWKDCHGVTADKLAEAESQLAALRRPVVQSADPDGLWKITPERLSVWQQGPCESYGWLYAEVEEAVDGALRIGIGHPPLGTGCLRIGGKTPALLAEWLSKGELSRLRTQLDQAQREIEDLKGRDFCEMDAGDPPTHVMANGRICIQCWNRVCDSKQKLADDVARLSSPPEERKEIVERHNSRLDFLRTHGYPLSCDPPGCDIETLLGDCAAWRNAHAVVTAERDDARGKVEQLQQMNEHLNHVRDDLVQVTEDRQKDADQYQAWVSPQLQRLGREMVRIERLEGALRDAQDAFVTKCAEVLKAREFLQFVVDDYRRYKPGQEPTPGLDCIQRIEIFLSRALAAADGQQEAQIVRDAGKVIKGAVSILAAIEQHSGTGDGVAGE